MLIVGDSFVEATGASMPLKGFAVLLAELLGVDNVIPAGVGGTGFLNDGGGGSGKVTFAGRIDKDLTLTPNDDRQLDVIAIPASGNDNGYLSTDGGLTVSQNQAAYVAAVNYCLSRARSRWPDAVVLGIGPYFKEAGTGNYLANLSAYMEGVMAGACSAQGCTYVPGMADAIGALSTPTRNSYYDGTGHWNDAGHAWGAATMDTLIRAAWPLG